MFDNDHIKRVVSDFVNDLYPILKESDTSLKELMKIVETSIITKTLTDHKSTAKAANTLKVKRTTLVEKRKRINV